MRLLVASGAAALGAVTVQLAGTPDGSHPMLIRPQSIRIDGPGTDATVASSAFVGPGWMVTLKFGDTHVEVETARPWKAGDGVAVTIDPAGITVLER